MSCKELGTSRAAYRELYAGEGLGQGFFLRRPLWLRHRGEQKELPDGPIMRLKQHHGKVMMPRAMWSGVVPLSPSWKRNPACGQLESHPQGRTVGPLCPYPNLREHGCLSSV